MSDAVMFRDKRDLLDWLERELPDDAQFLFPGVLGFTSKAASKRRPAPRLEVDLVFPTDALTDNSPATDISWLAGGPRCRIKALIPIVVARPDTFTEAEADADKT